MTSDKRETIAEWLNDIEQFIAEYSGCNLKPAMSTKTIKPLGTSDCDLGSAKSSPLSAHVPCSTPPTSTTIVNETILLTPWVSSVATRSSVMRPSVHNHYYLGHGPDYSQHQTVINRVNTHDEKKKDESDDKKKTTTTTTGNKWLYAVTAMAVTGAVTGLYANYMRSTEASRRCLEKTLLIQTMLDDDEIDDVMQPALRQLIFNVRRLYQLKQSQLLQSSIGFGTLSTSALLVLATGSDMAIFGVAASGCYLIYSQVKSWFPWSDPYEGLPQLIKNQLDNCRSREHIWFKTDSVSLIDV